MTPSLEVKLMNIGVILGFKNCYLVTITVIIVLGKKLSTDAKIYEQCVAI